MLLALAKGVWAVCLGALDASLPPDPATAVQLKTYLRELEDEHWRAHTAEHQRDRDVLDKAAADVRQALDKAASEVDRRLVDIREAFQNLLGGHLELHGSDREALKMAREDIERRLEQMNELRVQINNERGTYISRDMFEDKHTALINKVELQGETLLAAFRAQGELIRSETKVAMEKVTTEQMTQNRRLNDLENHQSNMDGKFAVLGGVLAVAILVIEFVARQIFK